MNSGYDLDVILPRMFSFAVSSLPCTPQGGSGWAMVVCNFQCQGLLLIWIIVGKKAFCACSKCRMGLFGHFFCILLYLLSLCGRWPNID